VRARSGSGGRSVTGSASGIAAGRPRPQPGTIRRGGPPARARVSAPPARTAAASRDGELDGETRGTEPLQRHGGVVDRHGSPRMAAPASHRAACREPGTLHVHQQLQPVRGLAARNSPQASLSHSLSGRGAAASGSRTRASAPTRPISTHSGAPRSAPSLSSAPCAPPLKRARSDRRPRGAP
jgi:hypothetical protein